jgi:hypothetical protein
MLLNIKAWIISEICLYSFFFVKLYRFLFSVKEIKNRRSFADEASRKQEPEQKNLNLRYAIDPFIL